MDCVLTGSFEKGAYLLAIVESRVNGVCNQPGFFRPIVEQRNKQMQMQQIEMWGGREISCFKDKLLYGEINLEKSAKIFFPPIPAGDKRLKEPHIETLPPIEIVDDSGQKTTIEPYIEIIPPKKGERYNTDTHDVLYTLYQLWEDAGSPDEPFDITLRKIARMMGQSTGQKNLGKIKDALTTLYSTEVHFHACFVITNKQNSDEDFETKRFRVLNKYDNKDKRRNGKTIFSEASLSFDPHLIKSLIAGKKVPVNYVQRMSIKNKLSRAVYGVYDTYLTSEYGKTPNRSIRRELRMETCLKDFKQDPLAKSKRLRAAQTIARNLNGAALSRQGLYMSVEVVPTSCKQDHKLIFRVVGTSTSKKNNISYINNDENVEGMIKAASDILGPTDKLPTRTINTLKLKMRKTHKEICLLYTSPSPRD